MIVRIEIEGTAGALSYSVTQETEALYGDADLDSVLDCLVAAVEGLPPEIVVAEIWFRGIVSGTYPLQVIGLNAEQVAEHATRTTAAVEEALGHE